MIIEMVAREIGEDSAGECQTRDAVLMGGM